jgi:glycerol uptake facilitator-like aquaporin
LVGTLILVMLIPALTDQGRSNWIPAAVGAWVATMVFSTVSTGFLNPALTLARMFTDTYTGIAPANVPGFMIAQLLGAALAIQLSIRLLIVPDPKGT